MYSLGVLRISMIVTGTKSEKYSVPVAKGESPLEVALEVLNALYRVAEDNR